MANVWMDATAPYVLVAAVGAMGWIVNTSVADLKQANIIEYEITSKKVGESYVKEVDIYNRSLIHHLSSGKFTFRCSELATADCFVKSQTGTPITFMPLSGVSYNSDISTLGVVYAAEARLAPQSGVRYQVSMKSPNEEVVLLYEPGNGAETRDSGLIFRRGESWEGWLMANYLGYLVQTFIALSCLLALWFGAALIHLGVQWLRKPESNAPPKEPETFRIIVEQREVPNG